MIRLFKFGRYVLYGDYKSFMQNTLQYYLKFN